MFYLYNFNLINLNERDVNGNIPIYYLIKNHSEDSRKNREMFLWLSYYSNLKVATSESLSVIELLNDWQRNVYEKYVKNAFIKTQTITTEA